MSQKRAMLGGNKQAQQLKELIARGKEQGYLTYAEVNDHLPNDIVDPEQIEDIVNMINDMGITVHEKAPDAESLVLSDATATDDEAAEEAEAALASVDAEFGRTTDPVRMYMREMGTVELLTRQGEIEIAKRIEDGLNQVKQHMSSFPPTVEALLQVGNAVVAGDTRMQDFIVGFIDPNEPDEIKPPAPKSDDDDDEVVDTGPDPEEVKARVKKIQRLYNRVVKSIDTYGAKDRKTLKIQTDLTAEIMELKLAPKLFDALVMNLRDVVSIIRTQERLVMRICVRDAGMPRKDFLSSFPKSETDLAWVDKHIRAKRKHSSTLAKLKEDILRAQRKLLAVEEATMLTIAEIKEINRQMSIGEAKARRAK
ncbi:MAG: RNA polymerase sigma factor region1.1 domain-containing protein, partial [Pseudomonadota bacterium]